VKLVQVVVQALGFDAQEVKVNARIAAKNSLIVVRSFLETC
jgi:hypothetical protein